MTSSNLKTLVFTRAHEYDDLRFQKSPPWGAYLKTSVFGARKRRLRVDGSRIRRKSLRFRKYPATCGRGLNQSALPV